MKITRKENLEARIMHMQRMLRDKQLTTNTIKIYKDHIDFLQIELKTL